MATLKKNLIAENKSNEISFKNVIEKFREWLSYLKLKIKLIIILSIFGAIIGLYYAKLQKPVYKATITFILDDELTSAGVLDGIGINGNLGTEPGLENNEGLFSKNNVLILMKSRSIIERTLLNPVIYNSNGKQEIISLAEYYIRMNNMSKNWKKKMTENTHFFPSQNRLNYTLNQNSILEKIYLSIIKNNLLIGQKDKKSNIKFLEVTSIDENFSKSFCENLAKEITSFFKEIKTKKSKTNIDDLRKENINIRQRLDNLINQVAASSEKNYNINPSKTTARVNSNKKQIEVQIYTAMLNQNILELELAKSNIYKVSPVIQIIDKPIFPLEIVKINRFFSFILAGLLTGIVTISYLLFLYLYNK